MFALLLDVVIVVFVDSVVSFIFVPIVVLMGDDSLLSVMLMMTGRIESDVLLKLVFCI